MPPKKPSSASATQYQAAYERLHQIASKLESGDSSLDQVLPLIQEAQTAYAVCQSRIEALRTLLGNNETDEGQA